MASIHSRGSMKKDISNKIERPSSGSSVSSKTSTSKSSSHKHEKHDKPKGPSKEELKKVNADLYREIEVLTAENQVLKATVSAVIDKLIENAKIKGVDITKEIYNPNVSEISTDSIVDLTEKTTREQPRSHTMEGRVEELETRITHLNMELAKLLRTKINIENGLDDLIEMDDLTAAKVKAKELKMEIRGSSLFTFLDSVLDDEYPDDTSSDDTSLDSSPSQTNHRPASLGNSTTQTNNRKPASNTVSLKTQSELDLTPPSKKHPGDTHIKHMHKDLRQYVIQQLSLQKANGADWRMFGERIGIPSETLSQWKRWKLDNTMFYVLQTWSQSPGATVRLLHRHLVSPQMRNTLLAKRISDFYLVD